jgi:hypothetical protein
MKIARHLVLCLTLVSSTALANPIMMVMRLSAESTGSTHVRLRYLTNYGSSPSLATYGTSHSDWFTTGDSTSEDTGSGVKTMTYEYMCDCHVPTGSPLTYQVETPSGMPSYYTSQLTVTLTPSPSSTTLCDDKCAQADSRDASVDTGAGTATGGSTAASTSAASSASTATGGSTAGGAGTIAGTTSAAGGSSGSEASTAAGGSSATAARSDSASEDKKGGGACSFSSDGRAGALSFLLALGLVAFSLRRRR